MPKIMVRDLAKHPESYKGKILFKMNNGYKEVCGITCLHLERDQWRVQYMDNYWGDKTLECQGDVYLLVEGT